MSLVQTGSACKRAVGRMKVVQQESTFPLLAQARSSFHLGVLEPVYIKTRNPVLCTQKEFVSLLDSSIKRRVTAHWLVIKATNHARHFPLTWFSIHFWLFRFCLLQQKNFINILISCDQSKETKSLGNKIEQCAPTRPEVHRSGQNFKTIPRTKRN